MVRSVWVQLGLEETSILDIIHIDIIAVLDVFDNDTDFQLGCNSVRSDDEILMIYMNEVDCEISLSAS